MATVIKKFLLLEITDLVVNGENMVELSKGSDVQEYYYTSKPNSEFDTEEEAITEAEKRSLYGDYCILPIFRFENELS